MLTYFLNYDFFLTISDISITASYFSGDDHYYNHYGHVSTQNLVHLCRNKVVINDMARIKLIS